MDEHPMISFLGLNIFIVKMFHIVRKDKQNYYDLDD